MSLRYSIWVSVDKTKGETWYSFKDNSVKTTRADVDVVKGIALLFSNGNFVTMNDAHAAIVFCNYLNEQEGVRK